MHSFSLSPKRIEVSLVFVIRYTRLVMSGRKKYKVRNWRENRRGVKLGGDEKGKCEKRE